MTVKQEYDKLNKENRALLHYAFENGLSQSIKINDTQVFGVNLTRDPNLKIIESAGSWSIAEKKG